LWQFKNHLMNRIIITLIFGLLLNSCISNKYPSKKIYPIQFDTESKNQGMCDLTFPNPKTDKELIELRQKYKLDELTSAAKSDIEKAMVILNWTNARWEHDGRYVPEKSDAMSILEGAETGMKFRCVEYGIVLSATLNSIGIPTRTLALKTKDVEITKLGAGHVVSEAYIPDLKKWVFMDAQINYIPFRDNKPLNAFEYQNAIINNKENIELKNIGGEIDKVLAKKRINWVAKYLFYFDVRFDCSNKKMKCKDKSHLMLVPLNEKKPTLFQNKFKIDYCIYTNNLKDFYKIPKVQ